MTLLFVYGTLRRGAENHKLMAGARWVGPAQTAARYQLIDLGAYSGLTEGGASAVAGELFEVGAAELAALDAFEEHPDRFRRAPI